MSGEKQDRIIEIFFRGLRGEDLSVAKLATEYQVSAKSISRYIGNLKNFLADHRDLVGNTELVYSQQDHCYRLNMEEFLTNKELFALVEVLIGARAFSRMELLEIVDKLRRFSSVQDRPKLQELIRRELYHYPEVKHDCESVEATLWQLVTVISERREISIEYYRMDRQLHIYHLRPVSIMFTDYYFYLIAYKSTDTENVPQYFRVDRITRLSFHRKHFTDLDAPDFDEGLLRKRSLLMWPGKLRTIQFEFNGPSIQAVLDKLPTAQIIDRMGGERFLVEAEVYGDGIKMWLLSQGHWVKVLSPPDFVKEMRNEIEILHRMYEK